MDAPVARAAGRRSHHRLSFGVIAALALVLAGCTHLQGRAHEVTFVLDNGTIDLVGEVHSGKNIVHVTNVGTGVHELFFVQGAHGATLPTRSNGAMDEDRIPPGRMLDEVHLRPGESATGVFWFTPGPWVAVCNIVNGSNVHFRNGMWMDFTVD
jgi:uncharacterized cupredoxin-like copper-binding protein